ncbi:nucleoprotein TPR isoform X2 [Hermetia illucens]|uniref:nucleoprotein TPR isoform X2 n=1 Tax=Hermetia illucens TaxID=343691 RepID=UPI0018CC6114|nr:nucleoprotein TPR isoform X2 [Hermetia illucens]
MDDKGSGVLVKFLTKEELQKIPGNVKKKVEKYFEERFEEFLTAKALGEASKNSLDEVRENFEKQVADLTSKIQDYEAKLEASQQNVNELREQLDNSRQEVSRLVETTKKYEAEAAECRREKNNAIDERDSLMKMVERRAAEVERFQSDLKAYESQLQTAINAKCEAVAKMDEIKSKEVSLDYKEKRMEQEKAMLTNQIRSLSEDLNRNIAELQTIRRDNTMKNLELQTKLTEKTEELKIANSTISHLNETVSSLTIKAEDLAAKMLAQSEESTKMMEYYKKELQAKEKLADLYKNTSEDSVAQTNELGAAVSELKRLLNEASDQYGELETKMKALEMKHEQELSEKENLIQSLKEELKHANDLLKAAQDENLENAIEKLAPSAAVTTRLIKADMSLTELYSLYVKTTEELQLQKKENARAELQMKSILQELEEKAPIFSKLQLEHQKLIDVNNELSQQLENVITERVEVREELQESITKIKHLQHENKKLKLGQNDLARQVCYLLKEVEQVRGGFSSENEQSISSDMSANEVISKKLVTFGDITELQENNQKLILLVRDLSSKLEELEEAQNSMDQASYESKIASYSKRLQEMQESQDYQAQMLTISMQKCERYKKLYYDSMRSAGKNMAQVIDGSLNDQMEVGEEENIAAGSSNSIASSETIASKDKRINELEDRIKELTEQIKKMKEEHEEYRKEKLTNEKMMNEQFDSMRTELRELTSSNCKLMSTVEYNNEQIKIQQKNVATYKKQITTLEERNRNYENTIVKHEQTIMYLKDETMNAQRKLASAEVQLDNMKQECRLLRDTEARLHLEREGFLRERQTQNLLLNNLEMIKASFERSETEGRQRLEVRLDEAIRECSALRRRLQEEQDRFRELTVDLKRQTDTAKARMEEEQQVAEKLQQEVANLREELLTKTNQIDDLSKKLQESLTPSKNDNPIAQANKKAREFELKYEEAALEIESLKKEIERTREHAQQYCKLSQSSEQELKELHNEYSQYKLKTEEELKKLRAFEIALKSRIEELDTEIQLQITGAQLSSGNSSQQVQKVQAELKEALQKLSENNREMRDLREQCNNLTSSLQSVEQKYANEMMLHSADIQELSRLKEELHRVREQIAEIKAARDKSVAVLEEMKSGYAERDEKLKKEKEELEKRLIDLDAQNAALHDQIQALSSKLATTTNGPAATSDEAMNESTNADHSMTNKSFTDDESKSNDQLLQIIKYLRKEKDIAVAKVDILKSENVRLLSEQNIAQKKLEELNASLSNERTKSEVVVVTATKHEEILRKVETLNAITDSNRILREERDTLSVRVKELTERVTKVEDELFPLQEKNREQNAKIEEMQAENTSLRTEATRWRQRANILVERSNKNPEEFKRIQSERESLAKMLTAEKEALKQAHEELNSIRADKARLETEMNNLNRQIQTVTEEKKKVVDDFNLLKQQNTRLTQEIMELKNQLLQKEDELKKIGEDIASKDNQLADLKNKEFQIRKIAKRYKDSYFELKNQIDGKDGTGAAEGDPQNPGEGTSASKQETEKELKEKINELNAQIKQAQEETEKYRKENENFKLTLDKEERNKTLLKEAKTRILSLTETKNAVTRELAATKAQLQNIEQNRDDNDLIVSGIKSQYESRIARLEQDQINHEKESKETIARLTRENENLLLRINQLQRQLGLQQVSKPSTSSSSSSEKGSSDPPRTANVKPMSGPSGQQSATVTPWRGSETPLASIRPMSVQNSRTAAVLPTSQTSNVAAIQGSSSGSVTALVPPQQQVHTTGNSPGEAMSSSPTSSHTDYMPATSSAAVVVAAIPPMGANAAESSQEAESVPTQNNESTSSSSSAQMLVSGGQQQQAVALVSPRVEGTSQNIVPPQSAQSQDTIQPSTSGTSSTSNISVSSHHQASSSSTVTTTQAGGHKRPRDVEGDSSTSNEELSDKAPVQTKRQRIQTGEAAACQGVTESGLDVEYQVPTSSQRDQEDDIIIVDSEEDDGMADEGNADVDDGPMEDEADNGEGYEMEESYEPEQDIDEGEGPDIDEDNIQSDTNEVEVDDSSEVPNQSGTSSSTNHVAPDASTSQVVDQSTADQATEGQIQPEGQQIPAISSGSEAAGSSSQASSQSTSNWRQVTPLSRQQQATLLMLQQGYEETGDDSIVPSTPTLYAPRRADGEAVSSPHPQVPHAARFTFSESSSSTTTTSRPGASGEGGEDAHADMAEDTSGRGTATNIQESSSETGATVTESTSSTEKADQVAASNAQDAGPSRSEDISAEAGGAAADAEATPEGASTSDVHEGEQSQLEEADIEEEEGLDGVTSEGEKASAGTEETAEIEEGREAEATTSPTINTRSRTVRTTPQNRRNNRNQHQQRGGRPTPIIWQDQHRGGGGGGRHMNQGGNMRASGGNEQNSPQRGAFQNRGQRARRMRRPSGPSFGNRY